MIIYLPSLKYQQIESMNVDTEYIPSHSSLIISTQQDQMDFNSDAYVNLEDIYSTNTDNYAGNNDQEFTG